MAQVEVGQQCYLFQTTMESSSRAKLRHLTKPSAMLTPVDMAELTRVSQALTKLQADEVKKLVSSWPHAPIMVQYQGDSTPVRHAVHVGAPSSSSRGSVRRVGLSTSEAYLQRSFFMTGNVDAGFASAHRVFPPLILKRKTAWHQLACVKAAHPTLLGFGHPGIALSVYVFDIALRQRLGVFSGVFHTRCP